MSGYECANCLVDRKSCCKWGKCIDPDSPCRARRLSDSDNGGDATWAQTWDLTCIQLTYPGKETPGEAAAAARNRGQKCAAAVAAVPKVLTRRGGNPSQAPVASDKMRVAERVARVMLAKHIAFSRTQRVAGTVIGSLRRHRTAAEAAEATWHHDISLKRPSIASILSPLESCSRESWIPCP